MEMPCKHCPEKGCGAYHSQCELYQAVIKDRQYEKERRIKEYDVIDFKIKNIIKTKKAVGLY